jgi:hypothetical protein
MPEFDFLRNAKGYHLFQPTKTEYSNYEFVLSEKTEEGEYEVTLSRVPIDSILLRLDENKFDVSGIFDSGISQKYEGICKKADYILIDAENNKINFIELKLGTSFTNKEITHQLIGAECIFKYITYLITNYCKTKSWNQEEPFYQYNYNYIAICNIKFTRKVSYHKKEDNSTSPENFLRIDYTNNIAYKRLIS